MLTRRRGLTKRTLRLKHCRGGMPNTDASRKRTKQMLSKRKSSQRRSSQRRSSHKTIFSQKKSMLTGDLRDSKWARTFGFKSQNDGGKKYKSDVELEQFWADLVANSSIKPITVRGWKYLLNRNLYVKEKARKIAEIESVFFDGYLFPHDDKDILRYTKQVESYIWRDKSMLSTKGTRFSRHCKLKLYYDFGDNTFWLSPVHPSIVDDDLKLYYHAMSEEMTPDTLQSVSEFNAATEKSLYSQLNKCVPTTKKDERSGKRLPKICIQIPNPADIEVSLESNNWVEVEDLSLSRSFGQRTVYVAVPTLTFPVDPVLEEWSQMIELGNTSGTKNIPNGLRNADGSQNIHVGQAWDDTNLLTGTGINFCPRDEEPVQMGRKALYVPVTLKMLVVVKIKPGTDNPPDKSFFSANPSLQLDTNKLRELSKLLEPHVIVCEAFTLNTTDVEVGTILQLRLEVGTPNLRVRRMYERTVKTGVTGDEYTYTVTLYEPPLQIDSTCVKKTTFDIKGFVKLFPTKEMQSATARYLDDGQVPYQFYNKQKKLDYNIDNQIKVYDQKYDVTCKDAWDKKDGIRSSLSIKNANGNIVLKCCRSAGTILWALRQTAPVLFLPSDSAGTAYVGLNQRMIQNIKSDDEDIEQSKHDVWRVSAVVKTNDREHTSLVPTTGARLPTDVDNTVWKNEGFIGNKNPSFNVCCLCPKKMLSCWEPIVRRYHHGAIGSTEKYYAYFPGTSNIKGGRLPNCMYCGESYENHNTKVACDESSTTTVFDELNTAPPIEQE